MNSISTIKTVSLLIKRKKLAYMHILNNEQYKFKEDKIVQCF